jgi:RimJ/RimL family protein N-acetyltransferase
MTTPSVVQPVTLEGAHVRLEPLAPGHVDGLVEAARGSRVPYTTFPDTPEGMRRYVAAALLDQSAGTSLPFATVERASGRVLGATRFLNIEYWAWPDGNPHQRGADRPDAVEIGATWLTAAARRTSVNTEAKLVMLRHAFEVWRVHRVRLMTDARNVQSRDAILRLGTRFDGILRAAREGSDGAIRDTAAYSLLEAEWPGVKARLERRLSGRGASAAPPGPAAALAEYAALPRDDRLARLARTGAELAGAVVAANAATLARRPAPQSWAAVEVLCHLRDTEESFLQRMQLIVATDEPRFATTNPDRWATDRQYLANDAAAALATFRTRRHETLVFVGGLAADDWARAGHQMDSRGRRTIDDFVTLMAWHDDNHLAQLRRALDGRE